MPMKLNIDTQEREVLQIIQMHTGCSSKSAIELLADLKHLVDGKPEAMKYRANTADKMVAYPNASRKRGFL